MPTFSIIVPVYNVEKYINEALGSLKKQTFEDFEVLCVDDCGTDNSAKIVEEYTKKDRRFKLIRHEKNQGAAQARNTALAQAKGEYIIFFDPDDKLEHNALTRIYHGYKKSGLDSVWFVNCDYYEEDDHISIKKYELFKDKEGVLEITPENLYNTTRFITNKSIRRSKLEELGLKFENFIILEDENFFIKCFTQIKKIYYINEALYIYRHRGGSAVDSVAKGNLNVNNLFEMIENTYNFLKDNNLFEEYKVLVLRQMTLGIQHSSYASHRTKVIDKALETLDKIGFPEEYKELDI